MGREFVMENGALEEYRGRGGEVTLPEVVFPEGTASIGAYTFWNCGALETAVLPVSVTRIGDGAFEDCPALTICAPADSFAAQCAAAHGIPVQIR